MSAPVGGADSDDDRQLGMRIRQVRRARQVTLKDAATAAGVSESFLSQVERGMANPSVASLRRIADALDTPIAHLFSGAQSDGMLVRAADRRRMTHPGGAYEDFLLTSSLARNLQIHQTVIGPGAGSGDEPYTHDADEECVVVLEGELEITVQGETYDLREGDSLVLNPRQGHRFSNPLNRPTTVLWVMTPANNY